MREIRITENEAGQRADKFLMKYLDLAPKGFVYKMLRKKNFKIDGVKATGDETLNAGSVIQVFLSDETINNFRKKREVKAVSRSLSIIYEDESLIAVNKPAGVLSQPAEKGSDAMSERLLSYFNEKGELCDTGFVPAFVGRLDRNTSGVLIGGKTAFALKELNRLTAEHKTMKTYMAVVKGKMNVSRVLKDTLEKDEESLMMKASENGKEAETACFPLKSSMYCGNWYTALKVRILTGRFHQIRAQLSGAGFPIIGDKKYGDEAVNLYFRQETGLQSQFLHAAKLVLNWEEGHRFSERQREFEATLPPVLYKTMYEIFKEEISL